jgi:hypothetical protein
LGEFGQQPSHHGLGRAVLCLRLEPLETAAHGALNTVCELGMRTLEAGITASLASLGPDYSDVDHLPDDLKWGGNFFMAALGAHNWGYTAIPSAQRPEPGLMRPSCLAVESVPNYGEILRGRSRS